MTPSDGGRGSSTAAPSGAPLTDQQRRAVTARGVSVALSASAGCGKTFVLTERFLAELEPDGAGREKGDSPHLPERPEGCSAQMGTVPFFPARLGQLVAITFTERAAREMRDRIRKACNNRLQNCPENQIDYWLALVRELDSARISTIHSFCGSLLRSHAVEAGIDPRFRVLDGAQAATLLFELVDNVLRDRLAERNEAALALVVRFGLVRLGEMIARLLAVRQEIDWPLWQRETAEGLTARWEQFWRCDSVPRILRQVSDSPAARTVVDIAMRYPPAHPKMRERCDFLREQIPKLAEGYCGAGVSPAPSDAGGTPAPQARLAAIREAAKVQGGGTKKDWVSEKVYEQFRDAAKELRDTIDDVGDSMRFDPAAARPAAELALQTLGLAADVAQQYAQRKRELGVLDFNDLLIGARDLLIGPERSGLRKRLAAQIHLLLVDEFQDTDPLQVELVKALCDNEHLRGKLFFVGDFKQSIYRFRGAQPHVFRGLREEIPAAGRLPLSLNFRSQPAVLDFVNALFADELGPDYEPLRPHRPQVSPTPAVELLLAGDTGNTEEDVGAAVELPHQQQAAAPLDDMGPQERLRRREADWIARRIRAMLDAGEEIVWDEAAAKAGKPAARAVRPGDIALLFRALTNVEYYEESLRRYGIDYYLVGGHAFYAQQEIYDLLNLLRTINSPCDEVSLAGTLRSPMFGLLDESLLWLSQHPDGLAAGLFDWGLPQFSRREEHSPSEQAPSPRKWDCPPRAAGDFPEELEGSQRDRVTYAAAMLGELRAMKDRLPVAQLIGEALERTGYDALLLAEFLGERKLANLHKLVEQARSFDAAGIFTLSDFITQLGEFVAREPDEALAATHPMSTDVVKLMSIHQAKGLEFPVVIVPDIGRPRRVVGPSMAFTPELGPMFKQTDIVTGYDLFMLAENDEELAELSRLLYVAATRAADYLILSAGVEEPRKTPGPWFELLTRRMPRLAPALVPGAVKTQKVQKQISGGQSPAPDLIRLITAAPPIQSKPVDLRSRRDLMKILEKARQMAEQGAGIRPRYLAPVPFDASARRQYSFSRLSGRLHARLVGVEVEGSEADISGEPPLDARGLGTLVHAVLAEIDFAAPGDITTLVERHAQQHLSSAEQNLDEPIEMIDRFLHSPRAEQIKAAKQRYAELEFLLAWPPDGNEQPESRYLQGFIDCLYCDAAGQWRVIDYKTNRVTADTLAAAAAPYEMQMLVYALAVERILQCPPAELALCFLRPGLEHHFTWDAAARQRVVEMVNGALP
jgi:ATP-dependent helicase/nuclease subunit A